MQDRYVGDVGDFGKYGLLRKLISPQAGQRSLRLGVNWYKVPNESHNNDGGHVAYLRDESAQSGIRDCDPDLYDTLKGLVAKGRRTIAAIQTSGILPDGTIFFDEPLSFSGTKSSERAAHRLNWMARAADAMADADVVFLDPDNGLEVRVPLFSQKGPKYASMQDLRDHADRGQSVVVYNHMSRQGSVNDQIHRRLKELRDIAARGDDLFALRYKRGTARAYLVIGRPDHLLLSRAEEFLRSRWAPHFDLVDLRATGR